MATASFSSVRPIAARCRDAELLAQPRVDRQRQEAGRRGDPIVLDDHRAVVQRRRRLEDADEQVVGQHGVERNAALDVVAQADLPLDDDDRADPLRRQHAGRDHELLDRLVGRSRALARYRKNGARPRCASARRMSDWNSTMAAKTT